LEDIDYDGQFRNLEVSAKVWAVLEGMLAGFPRYWPAADWDTNM